VANPSLKPAKPIANYATNFSLIIMKSIKIIQEDSNFNLIMICQNLFKKLVCKSSPSFVRSYLITCNITELEKNKYLRCIFFLYLFVYKQTTSNS